MRVNVKPARLAWPLLLCLVLAAPSVGAGASSPLAPHSIAYDLPRMRQVNPDFSTYPDAQGIIWLKETEFARAKDGGMEETHLWVILGRRGLDERWLTWNIPDPGGEGWTEVIEAKVHDFDSGQLLTDVFPVHDGGLHVVRFGDAPGLPETFILTLAWRVARPEQIAFEGLCWTQESLPLWESVIEARVPEGQTLLHRAFPQGASPEAETDGGETTYTWRRINVDPMDAGAGLTLVPRAGVAFSMRREESALTRLMRDVAPSNVPAAPSQALDGFRRSAEDGMVKLLSWLHRQPELVIEGARPISASGPWTREEKLTLAQAWLKQKGVGALLRWRLPLELDENPPVCAGLLQGALLELPVMKGSRRTSETFFYDMEGPPSMGDTSPLLHGARIVGLSDDGRLLRKKVPGVKAADNRLSALMDLRLNDQGMLSGEIRALLRGAWGPLLLPAPSPTPAQLRETVQALFPGLQNYDKVQLRSVKGVPELSFNLEGKPGVGGTGQGLLALPPLFEPTAFRALGGMPPPIELRFPFVIEQTLTIGLPKGAERALISAGVAKTPGKITYTESYKNRRHRVIAEARCEVDVPTVTVNDMDALRRGVGLWHNFGTRHIPVR